MSEKNKGLTFNHDRLLGLFRDKCGLISEFQDFRIIQVPTYVFLEKKNCYHADIRSCSLAGKVALFSGIFFF